ncbi:hypothetical protein [Litoribacterium kuwaitense]|nr:hypothetical protein [Litoribacterium kuwaitense]
MTQLKGEASFLLDIETEGETLTASGVFADFFAELETYTEVKK